MAPIPLQRDTVQRPGTSRAGYAHGPRLASRTSLPGIPLAPSAARRFVRAALAEWTGLGVPAAVGFSDRLADDAVTVTNELVTNAVVHAGTTVDLVLRLEEEGGDEPSAALVLEVTDHHPARPVGADEPGDPARTETEAPAGLPDPAEYGRGLQLVATLAESWGITYRTGLKTVWARLPVDDWSGPAAPPDQDSLRRGLRAAEILAPAARRTERDDAVWDSRGALSFLAEASDLLAGQLDEDLVAALAGQLLVPRLADWCAVWLEAEGGGPGAEPRLARVWHQRRDRYGAAAHRAWSGAPPPPGRRRLRPRIRARCPGRPRPRTRLRSPAPATAPPSPSGSSRRPGARHLLVGRAGLLPSAGRGRRRSSRTSHAGSRLAVGAARAVHPAGHHQPGPPARPAARRGRRDPRRRQRPRVRAERQGRSPAATSTTSSRPAGGRWCFVLGDVQGKGPEAAVVTGLARPWLRLLAREGYGVARGPRPPQPAPPRRRHGGGRRGRPRAGGGRATAGLAARRRPAARFLSLLYGELVPSRAAACAARWPAPGTRCRCCCAPTAPYGPSAEPQMLLGVVEDAAYESETFDLRARRHPAVRHGRGDRAALRRRRCSTTGTGWPAALAGCAGLTRRAIAERIRRAGARVRRASRRTTTWRCWCCRRGRSTADRKYVTACADNGRHAFRTARR